MSARLPRGKGVGKLTHSSEEYKKQAKCSTRTSAARTVQQGGAAPASDHPWAGFGEWLLQPLPAEWRYNIQRTLSSIGEAVNNLINAQQGTKRIGGRRGF